VPLSIADSENRRRPFRQHLGDDVGFLPLQHGFDEYFGLPYSNDMWPVDYDGNPVLAGNKSGYPPLPLIEGNEVFTDQLLLRQFERPRGGWLRSKVIDDAVESISKLYSSIGYIFSKVSTELVERGDNVADLVVKIRVALNPDGSVRRAEIVDAQRMMADAFYRSAAENARRAILRCSPFNLPTAQFEIWRDMTLNFDPRAMFGG